MRIVTLIFGNNFDYERMVKVLRHTAAKHCPSSVFEMRRVDGWEEYIRKTQRGGIGRHSANNALKTKCLMEVVEQAQDGELLCLIDADTFITGDLATVEEFDFDLAVTDKEGMQRKAPINTGVLFVRVSDKTRRWFREWYEVVEGFLENPRHFQQLKRTYLGINQSALSVMMGKEHDLNLLLLPCKIWNNTTITWPLFSKDTKVVHILGDLRRAIFNNRVARNVKVLKLRDMWKSLEKEMKGQRV